MPPPSSWPGFVAVPENRSALHAVRRVVRAIQTKKRLAYDILVLCGPTGSGKSHLATLAVGEIPSSTILPASDFGRNESKLDLANVELLVIEDIQLLKAQFSDALTALLDNRAAHRRYTIVTTGKPLNELTDIPYRLTSRLVGGLVVHLGVLSPASRVKFVRHFVNVRRRKIPEKFAIEIAEHSPGGIRPLIGAVEEWIAANRMQSDGTKMKLRMEELIDPDVHPLSTVVEKVSKAFGISVEEIRGRSQLPSITTARQVAILLGRLEFKLKFKVIGSYLNRSSSSIFGSESYLRWKMVRDPQLTIRVNSLMDECREHVRKLVAHSARE